MLHWGESWIHDFGWVRIVAKCVSYSRCSFRTERGRWTNLSQGTSPHERVGGGESYPHDLYIWYYTHSFLPVHFILSSSIYGVEQLIFQTAGDGSVWLKGFQHQYLTNGCVCRYGGRNFSLAKLWYDNIALIVMMWTVSASYFFLDHLRLQDSRLSADLVFRTDSLEEPFRTSTFLARSQLRKVSCRTRFTRDWLLLSSSSIPWGGVRVLSIRQSKRQKQGGLLSSSPLIWLFRAHFVDICRGDS